MILKPCLKCPHHIIRENGKEKESFCQKENCWSVFSKCIARKALERFLDEEKIESIERSKSEDQDFNAVKDKS